MEILEFKDIYNLYLFMTEIAETENKVITAVLHFEDAAELVKYLTADDEVLIGHIDIADYDYNGYDREFYVSLDTDFILDVCPVIPNYDNKGNYVPMQETDIMLYGGDVKQAIVNVNDCKENFEIKFVDDEDYDAKEAFLGIIDMIDDFLKHLS